MAKIENAVADALERNTPEKVAQELVTLINSEPRSPRFETIRDLLIRNGVGQKPKAKRRNIAEAPRDGTYIILVSESGVKVAAYYGQAKTTDGISFVFDPADSDENYPWVVLDHNGDDGVSAVDDSWAEYWLEMPE